jgi:hypothetical protein
LIARLLSKKSTKVMTSITFCFNLEMTAVLDLVNLYSDINREIIEQNLDPKGMSEPFRRATELMNNIRDLL